MLTIYDVDRTPPKSKRGGGGRIEVGGGGTTIGSIDESALTNLSLVVNLSKSLQVKQNG